MSENQNEPLSTNNGHANPTATSTVEPVTELDADAQKQLAGLTEEELLIPDQYIISPDSPQSEKSSSNPIAKVGFVAILIGGVMGLLALIWFSLFVPKPNSKQVKVEPRPTVTPQASSEDENARLKSKLAFQDQKSTLEEPQPVGTLSSQRAKNATTPTRPTTTPARPTTPTPAPRWVRTSPPPTPAQILVRTPPTPARTPAPTRSPATEPIDPFERWSQLASLGQTKAESNIEITKLSTSSTDSTDSPDLSQTASSSSSDSNAAFASVYHASEGQVTTSLVSDTQLPSVAIGAVGNVSGTSVGTQGILSRTRFQTQQQVQKTVLPGTIAPALVAMPMVWDTSSQTRSQDKLPQRFTVELIEPLLAEDRSVALPAGTVFVAQVSSVSEGNNVVSASAVAAIYRDGAGNLHQHALPEGAILIRGEGGGTLVSKTLNNSRGAVVRQDLLIGVLSGLNKVGEIVNRPRSQTIATGSGYSQITIQSDPQVWAAALEGVFGVTAERLSERSDQTIKELLRRPNVKVLAAGNSASVVVSSFFQVMP
ncbi:TrbI/VirB10 family protein [Gloeocapsopsis sp. IPPAS B-1203]|uniref:TrbI/VirB10 family protein n=1 Tax=Gloeocapsopsis sp. IPPAS B-1203 TaxID=2049454 RepID=UPI000C1951C0|nr:TrbI/VirB10 family protein [Gloeocapsopsis sp. IPPAS B-1203]PIG91585.1 hypothetical protein CSQ79_20300 [Gloeocapsopsis sp. IPPAS B-1203]